MILSHARIWRPNSVAMGDYVAHVMLYDLVINSRYKLVYIWLSWMVRRCEDCY